jgi:hypothetical protein
MYLMHYMLNNDFADMTKLKGIRNLRWVLGMDL